VFTPFAIRPAQPMYCGRLKRLNESLSTDSSSAARRDSTDGRHRLPTITVFGCDGRWRVLNTSRISETSWSLSPAPTVPRSASSDQSPPVGFAAVGDVQVEPGTWARFIAATEHWT
jgi:hypothetical protein